MSYEYRNLPLTADHFAIQVTEKNSAFIEASMTTARQVFPPLSTFIDWALQQNRPVPAQIPEFLRHATCYELFKIYGGPDVIPVQTFIQTIQNDDYLRIYMGEIGYEPHSYLPFHFFIKREFLSSQNQPLTPSNFVATLTPDQIILMEGWRQTALHIGLNSKEQRMHVLGPVVSVSYSKKLPATGYSVKNYVYSEEQLRQAITKIDRALGHPGLTRQHIMHPGETAIASAGRTYRHPETGKNAVTKHDRDMSGRRIPQHCYYDRGYFAMLYYELFRNGHIDTNGQVF